MTFQAIQATKTWGSTSELEEVSLDDVIPTEEELNAAIAKQDAGIELSEREYAIIERAAFGAYDDGATSIR